MSRVGSLAAIVTSLSMLLSACGGLVISITPYSSNGEGIYFTATSVNTGRIDYEGGIGMGPGMMMGGDLACVSCHGEDARGGELYTHMSRFSVPDIRPILAGEAGHDDDHRDEHEEAHEGYGFEDFRRAVVEGRHPDGSYLNPVMPRWDISDSDLDDLMQYLQSLP